jgi:Tfp pilus assembly protein PilX
MTIRTSKVNNQNGSVTIIAGLLILVVLTLIGISATSTTTVELQIAANDQFSKIAFFNADSGLYSTPKLISTVINTSAQAPVAANLGSTAPGMDYVAPTTQLTFFQQVMGYLAYDGGAVDVTLAPGGITTSVDVRRDRSENIVGGSAEFASGAEGIGTGSTGGVALYYAMRSDAQGPPLYRPSISQLGAEYRKVVGLAGGL